MKASIRLFWTRSASADIASRKITITKNGETTVLEVGPEVNEYVLDVDASSSVVFLTEVTDSEGRTATSEAYSFTVGDLVPPQPDTGLGHEVLAVSEA